jgi:hypothetical protein
MMMQLLLQGPLVQLLLVGTPLLLMPQMHQQQQQMLWVRCQALCPKQDH